MDRCLFYCTVTVVSFPLRLCLLLFWMLNWSITGNLSGAQLLICCHVINWPRLSCSVGLFQAAAVTQSSCRCGRDQNNLQHPALGWNSVSGCGTLWVWLHIQHCISMGEVLADLSCQVPHWFLTSLIVLGLNCARETLSDTLFILCLSAGGATSPDIPLWESSLDLCSLRRAALFPQVSVTLIILVNFLWLGIQICSVWELSWTWSHGIGSPLVILGLGLFLGLANVPQSLRSNSGSCGSPSTVQNLCHSWPSATGIALPPWPCPGTAEWIFMSHLYYLLTHLYSPTASSFHLHIFSLVNLGFL